MATWRDLVNQSLQRIGAKAIGNSIDSDEAENARQELNGLLGLWRNNNLLSYGISEIAHTFVPGQNQYEIGPTAADIVTTRPMDVRQIVFNLGGIWSPIQLLENPEDWNRFARLDTLSVPYPSYFRYMSDVPNGTIEFYPKPSSSYAFKVVVEQIIPQNVSLNDTMTMPPGYEAAFSWALSANLLPYYGMMDKVSYFESKATKFMEEIQTQNLKVPLLQTELGNIDEKNNSAYGQVIFYSGF